MPRPSTSRLTHGRGPICRTSAATALPRSSPDSEWPRTPSPSISRRSDRRPTTPWWPGCSICSAATGSAGVDAGIGLYHMILEGIVLSAGQHALLEDLEDGALPGVREGVERVELDERWHIGFGLRCLVEAQPSRELLDDLLARADEATEAWGDALPAATREHIADMCHHRLSAVGLIEAHAAA